MAKNKSHQPRAKRMRRLGRLQAAPAWLKTYTGKNVLRGYCKHFAVDWRCAAVELQVLGVPISPAYLEARETAEAHVIRQRQEKKQKRIDAGRGEHWHNYPDQLSAYLADDFAAMHEFEMWECLTRIKSRRSAQATPGRNP